MSIDDTVKDEKPVSWQDLFSLAYADLVRLSDGHQEIISSGRREELLKIARLHAKDLLPHVKTDADWYQVLNYLDQMLKEGKLDPLTVEEVQKTNGAAPSFQRLRTEKQTSKSYNDEGLLIESARFYPSGTVVRTFHSVFKDDSAWELATRGQRFYHGLVRYVKDRLGSKVSPSDDERCIAEKLSRASPILPLDSQYRMLDNVFVNGSDLQEHFKNADPSSDERVAILSEITDIDLITSYFSAQFRQTKEGRKLYKKGIGRKRVFEPKDTRKEVFEDILLKADRQLLHQLADTGVITTDGRIFDEKAFRVFYGASDVRSRVLDLIGVRADDVKSQRYFTPFDLNLGNVMMVQDGDTRSYTHIDFERSREDSLASLLFKRWAQSGIYDETGSSKVLANGERAEDQLFDNAYDTISRLHRIGGEAAPSKDEFFADFEMNKRKHLLRLARRYRSFENKGNGDKERLCANKRFFYTLFVKEVEKDAWLADDNRDVLEYLDTLFEPPLSQEEMSQVSQTYNPGFSAQEELNPVDVKADDLERKLRSSIEEFRQSRRNRRLVKGFLAAAGLAIMGGAAGGMYYAQKAYREKAEAEAKAQESHGWYERETRVNTLLKVYGAHDDTESIIAERTLKELERRFGDVKTAQAAFIDYDVVYEAIQESGGRTDWETIEKYLSNPDHGDSAYDVWLSMFGLTGYVDNFAWHTTDDDARRYVDTLDEQARRSYAAKKAAEQRAKQQASQPPQYMREGRGMGLAPIPLPDNLTWQPSTGLPDSNQ